MIIQTKEDIVTLSGSLNKNLWMTIRAAANLLLTKHPEGLIIDCVGLTDISENGAKTFLEAMRDIEGAHSRIMVVNLPRQVLQVCKTVPGVRSQLPIADSIEEARASLGMITQGVTEKKSFMATESAKTGRVIVVPLLTDLDLTYGATLAARIAQREPAEVRLVSFIEVPRSQPLNSPLLEEEQVARLVLDQAVQSAKKLGVTPSAMVERVRDSSDGILATIKNCNADMVVIGAVNEPLGAEGHDLFHEIVDCLLHRAPCEVIIGRQKINDSHK